MTPSVADSAAIRILLVDDHAIVRKGLRGLVEAEDDLTVCAEATSPTGALEMAEEHEPDLAVVDIALEGADGLDLISRLFDRFPDLRTLVLSMYDESVYAERALRAGASGYVMKDEATETLIEAIRTVLAGDVWVSDRIMERILRRMTGRRDVAGGSPLEALTDREIQVFRMIGEGRSTREVADLLHLSVKTIETHRANIMDKLDLDGASQLMHRAIEWVQRSRGGSGEEG